MKNCILIVVLLAISLAGCHRVNVNVKTETYKNKTSDLEVNIEKSVFSSTDAETEKSCEVLNRRIGYFIDSLQTSLKTAADTFFTMFAANPDERPVYNYELYVRDTVFMADKDLISVRMTVYTFQGGAHGMTDFYAFNYDVPARRFLTSRQILNFKDTQALDNLLKKNFVNRDSCFTEEPTVQNGFTALNVSPSAVCFTYPQYALGPYSCGYAQVYIPRTELKDIFLRK